MIKCNLRYLMADKKIDDITELMEKSGLSRNALNKIYKEDNIEKAHLDTLLKLCDAFGCNLSDLIEYVPDNK